LPGKPLLLIAGKPMIQHVWEQASKSSAQRVVVATDDARIVEACKGFGAEVVLTREDHNSGTDRLAEVAAKLGLAPDAIVVNVQGDEPLIPPSVIDQVAANLAAHTEARMATLAEPIEDVETLFRGLGTRLSRAASNCRKACHIAATSAFMLTVPASFRTSSPGARAGWKTPSLWNSCVPSGTACGFTSPMR
jgi:spore coat polysaccharide biosynthesis protein SpsF (cytidylyltransferase family)